MWSQEVRHIYEHYDWKMGLNDLYRKTASKYGEPDGSSGKVHELLTVKYVGDLSRDPHRNRLINRNLEGLGTCDGEVVILEHIGYSIARPIIKEYSERLELDPCILGETVATAVLIEVNGRNGYIHKVSEGSLRDMKKTAKLRIMQVKFEHDYIIIGKNIPSPLLVTGEGRRVRNTSKQSDSDCLVLPYYKFLVYGWAPSPSY